MNGLLDQSTDNTLLHRMERSFNRFKHDKYGSYTYLWHRWIRSAK